MGLWDKIKDGLTNSKGEIADAARDAAAKAQEQADAARQKADDAAHDAGQSTPEQPQAAPAPHIEPKADEPKAAPHVDEPVKPKKRFKEYTVVSGDTLSEIGARFGADWHEIARINHIENPDLIFPGQVFKIPVD
ncbi:LysM peptidoglycan-binding domain-containing protein [Nocardioides jejuensis]|uniref:LysM peptidoglycan-binding domain-containing protein n=1 Tax=Nocardioides jejuensis TaxID=2502782 RepID=A0A4R1C079_9ACTN|nr:LysM peptidoglycan-binding domain-containing protein [Nocardioides jejuensis]TCJ23397.1 LysM peptidoglycan-binding domain-containing protein [Nocardioides jejuensis]